MKETEADRFTVKDNDDLVQVRARVREAAAQMGFSAVDQVRLVTATSELARNMRLYADRGVVEVKRIKNDGRRGLQIEFKDSGPGILDIELAMTDGYTTSRGLGKGLPGSRRLVDEFEIESEAGKGTIIRIIKWLH